MEQQWTVLDMIQWATGYFKEKEVDSPRLTIELMLAHVTGLSRMNLYMSFDKPLNPTELDALRPMVKRRGKREPLQYILGTTNFFGLELALTPAVLIPRPETELLVEFTLHRLRELKRHEEALRVLDIGTGSGCIALALAKHLPAAHVVGVDVSADALAVARMNAARLGLANVEFHERDILTVQSTSSGDEQFDPFDVIISNPPYISAGDMNDVEPEVADFEPRFALTDERDGLTFYRRFADVFSTMLSERGFFAVEIGFGQSAAVESLFAAEGYVTRTEQDLARIPRVVMGWR
jgi:release factor glutamine methyltransferase